MSNLAESTAGIQSASNDNNPSQSRREIERKRQRGVAKKFLRWRYGDGPAQIVHGDRWKGEQVAQDGIDALLDRVGEQRFYFHVNELKETWTDPQTHKAGYVTSASNEHAAGSRFIAFDVDAKRYGDEKTKADWQSRVHYEHESERIFAVLESAWERLGIKPDAQWHTGAGIQGLFRLDRTIGNDQASDLTMRLFMVLGGDPNVSKPSQLLRVPGSVNPKTGYGRKPTDTTFHFANDTTTSVEALVAALDRAEASGADSAEPGARVSDLDGDPRCADLSDRGKRIIRDGFIEGETPQHQKDPSRRGAWLWDCCWEMAEAGMEPADMLAVVTDQRHGIGKKVKKKHGGAKNAVEAAHRIVNEIKSKRERVAVRSTKTDVRPLIEWWESDYPSIMQLVESILIKNGVGLYQSGGRLVHTYRHDRDDPEGTKPIARKAGALLIHDVSPERLNQYMTEAADFIKIVKGVPIPIAAPSMLSRHYLAAGDLWRVPVLNGFVECPTLRADGSIIQDDGYDPASGLMLDKNGVSYPAIPNEPTREECVAALKVLAEVLDEFPFVDDASRSVALSAILTGLVRHLMTNAPVHGFDANSIGTGKSTLADVVSIIATGRRAPAMTLVTDEVESIKTWLSILLAGDRVVSIDNVDPGQPVGGGTFNKIITQETFSARQLGVNKNPVVSTSVLIMVNGNNLTFSADAVSRAICARMDAGMENPDRRSFKRDIYTYVPQHRPALVAAALTVLRGYVAAGRPFQATESRFKQWDRLVRGALIWCGAADPMDTRESIDSLDPTKSDRASLITAMRKCFGQGAAAPAPTAQEIVNRAAESDDDGQALAAALRHHMGKAGTINSRAVTAYLKTERDVITDGHRIRMQPGKVARFWIERVENVAE